MTSMKVNFKMDDRELVGNVEYIRLLLWVIVLAVPVAPLTLLYLTIYSRGVQFYETFAETVSIPRPIFTIMVATLGGLRQLLEKISKEASQDV